MTESNPKRSRLWQVAIVFAVVTPLLAIPAYLALQPAQQAPMEDAPSPLIDRNRTVMVGGIRRPASDLVSKWSVDRPADDKYEVEASKRLIYGAVTPQQPAANPAVASVFEAVKKNSNPERMSPIALPKKFDRAAYQANPETYLSLHEPGRVLQSAQPGPGVPVLETVGRKFHRLTQGESIRLQVKTEPTMPVTFASFDIGTFDNGLATITVAADQEGLASATFHGSSGKVGEVNILAASPVATERVHFNVFINPPKASITQ